MFRNLFLVALFIVIILILSNCNLAADSNSRVDTLIFIKKADTRSYLSSQAQNREGPILGDLCASVEKEESGRIALRIEGGLIWFNKTDIVPISEAEKYFTSEIHRDAGNKYAFKCRGLCRTTSGETIKAIADYNEVIRLDSKDYSAYVVRGLIFTSQAEFDKALIDFDEAIRLEPTRAHVFGYRGRVWVAKGESDKALADMNELVRLAPKQPNSYHMRGLVWHSKKEYNRAIADFDEAIRLDNSIPEYFHNRGNIWRIKKNFRKALLDYDEAVRLGSENFENQLTRAFLLATCPEPRYRNGSQALHAAQSACELTRWTNPHCLAALAASYAETKQFSEAVKWQKEAINLAKNQKEVNNKFMKFATECLHNYETNKPCSYNLVYTDEN